jgi:hypothetical protein
VTRSTTGEDQPEDDPAERARGADRGCTETQVRPKHRRRGALALQVEQLALLVAKIGDERQREADQRERQGDERGAAEHEQNAARERIGLEPARDALVCRHRERRERRPAERGEVGVA